jgi:hypothetical protein
VRFMDKYGEEVWSDGRGKRRDKLSPDQVERARDILIVRLRVSRYTFREIARILNLDHSVIVRRYQAIPPKIRDFYAKNDWLRAT